MKLKNIVSSLAVVGLAASFTTPALAGYVVLDGWELVTSSGSTKNIGRLNLVSGTATVQQETDAAGNVFVGADFSESGSIFSISYTPENVVGAGDTGFPSLLHTGLTISFSNVAGVVTKLSNTGGFEYVFTSGNFSISSQDFNGAGGSIVGLGGTAAATNLIGGTTGDSTLLATILGSSGMDFKDSLGNSLLPGMATGEFLFEATTNNNITSISTVGACTLVTGTNCINLSAASAGDAYIVQAVPEPATLALLGLGLIGMGAMSRRRK